MFIKRSGKSLEKIDEGALIGVDIERVSELDRIASSDTPIHRAIYKNTPAKAVIHARSPYAVIKSLVIFRNLGREKTRFVEPLDIEGKYFLQRIRSSQGIGLRNWPKISLIYLRNIGVYWLRATEPLQ